MFQTDIEVIAIGSNGRKKTSNLEQKGYYYLFPETDDIVCYKF